jgi:hypothetical protein
MKKTKVICQECKKESLVFNSRAKDYKFCSEKCMSKHFSGLSNLKKGERINNWETLSDCPIRKNGRAYIEVKCTCGSEITTFLPKHHYFTKKSKGCLQCSRHYTYQGVGDLSGNYWRIIEGGAKDRNIEFSITKEYCWNLFLKQDKKCALTRLDLTFEKSFDTTSLKTASLDRIDSSKGYIEGNVQWVHKDVNIMKNKFEQDYFIEICKLVCNKN